MIVTLRILFAAIFAAILIVTIRTSLAVSLDEGLPLLLAQPWGVATLWDAYLGFLTFYTWVFYKERSVIARIIWFILVMTLGNIAMSGYMLIQLFRLPVTATARDILLRKADA